ncbi:hydroxymethylcytosylglucuronate/cytosylglucuronate synthase [Streptomyces sp. NPDC001635]
MGADFGWGSSGKLSAIITALRARSPRPLRFVGLGSRLGRSLLAELGVDRWHDTGNDPVAAAEMAKAEGAAAALVVLEGTAAGALEVAGIPTVFVDSLPFLWTQADREALPFHASVYCAQKCVQLSAASRDILDSVKNLQWVEAVVAPGVTERPASSFGKKTTPSLQRALVNFGGLQSPALADWTSYPRAVLAPVLDALATYGMREVHIAGNLPPEFLVQVVPKYAQLEGQTVSCGPLGHREFLERLAASDVLLTSPGLTTLLEAGALATPVVCLPPQNLSQIFNGRFHSRATGAGARVRWPEHVLSEDAVLADRTVSEEETLRVIYAGIASAAGDSGVRSAVRDQVLAALRKAADGADWAGLTAAVGQFGAEQVADHVLALLDRDKPIRTSQTSHSANQSRDARHD